MHQIFNYLADNHFALGVVSTICWSITYVLISLIIQNSLYMKKYSNLARVYVSEAFVSTIQGFLCGGIGILAIYKCQHDVMKVKYAPIDHYCVIGTGYFIYDLAAMYYSNWLLLKENGKLNSFSENFKNYLKNCGLMIAHHIILTAVLFPALITHSPMGHFFAGCFFSMELSSPFVNLRIILSKLGLKPTKLYLYNGILMMIVFAVFRVLIFVYMYMHFLFQMSLTRGIALLEAFKMIPFVCHFCCTVVISPQLYWLSMMINGVYIVLANRPKALDKYD